METFIKLDMKCEIEDCEGTTPQKVNLDEVVVSNLDGKVDHHVKINDTVSLDLRWMGINDKLTKAMRKLLEKINESFGDYDTFKTNFIQQAAGVFGSGWAWLIEKDGKLDLRGLPNAENPLAHGEHALMGVDVWEHAYYLDYKNVRPDYVKAVLDNIINWDFVADRLR